MVNAVLMTDFDNPNPRNDKLYPFSKFGYENIDEGKCFYYKSLAFKMQSDANIINTLYPMIVDGTYLNIFQPMVNIGSETIGSDVLVPGGVTTLSDPNSKITPIQVAGNLKAGMDTLMEVEKSVSESSEQPILNGDSAQSGTTAYEISRQEQNANTVLGLFIKMIAQFVRQYGRLRVGDIIQYLTIVDADKITDQPDLVYKSFIVKGKGKDKSKKIQFTQDVPEEPITAREKLDHSYKVLAEEERTGMEIYKANPTLTRELCYKLIVSPDVLHPRSEDLERAQKLELYDRAIANPTANQEAVFKDFLLGAYHDITEPDDYVQKQQPQMPQMQGQPMQGQMGGQQSPLASMSKMGLPQNPAMPKLG
jgi:archaellum component FlaF (FlaF/FlaG flagellin family)